MRSVSSVLAGLLFLAAFPACAQAVDTLDFVIPDNDGYGIAECMKPGMECGRVIADAWCEAHGHAHAAAFGSSDDVTGSVSNAAATASPSTPGHGFIIRCGE